MPIVYHILTLDVNSSSLTIKRVDGTTLGTLAAIPEVIEHLIGYPDIHQLRVPIEQVNRRIFINMLNEATGGDLPLDIAIDRAVSRLTRIY